MSSEPEKEETFLSFEVPSGYQEDARIDIFLTEHIQNASRAKVQRGIKEGRVSVNGCVVNRVSQRVSADDSIECRLLRPPPMDVLPENIPIDIVYEDSDLLIVNKSAGMVVHPAYGNRTGTLVHALLYHVGCAGLVIDPDASGTSVDPGESGVSGVSPDPVSSDPTVRNIGLSGINTGPRFDGDIGIRPGIVHRLDKDTSGLLVVAKNDVAHTILAGQFAQRTIHRRYQAIVWGTLDPPEGRQESWLGRDPRDRRRVVSVPEGKGKHAITNYKVIEPFGYTSLVEFRLETGRTHQIRIHALDMGHPVFGDVVYGGGRIRFGVTTGSRNAFYRNLFARLPRQALHAFSLGFRHPTTGEDVYFEAPLPPDMDFVVSRLRSVDLV